MLVSRGHFRSSHVAGSSIGLALRPEISNTVDRAHYARGRGRSVSGRPEARGRSHPARTYRPIVARTPGRASPPSYSAPPAQGIRKVATAET